MFRLGDDLQVYLHREPIDFRAGINSLGLDRKSSEGLIERFVWQKLPEQGRRRPV